MGNSMIELGATRAEFWLSADGDWGTVWDINYEALEKLGQSIYSNMVWGDFAHMVGPTNIIDLDFNGVFEKPPTGLRCGAGFGGFFQ